MNVFIVYAHEEPRSFNGAMRDLAVSVLTAEGHQVQVSDLYAMNFKATADRRDFTALTQPDHLKYQVEQRAAAESATFAPDIQAEIDKLMWADLLIFQSPLWWFSLPAILKGWVDRVFAFGVTYGPGKTYETGPLKGKKAMLALTTGGPESTYQPGGRNGELHLLLYPIHHGMLYFCGMDVLPPFVAWSPVRVEPEVRRGYLDAYRQRLLTIDSTPCLSWA